MKNITKNGGAQARLIELVRPDELILKCVSNKLGQLWAIVPATTLIDLVAKNKGIYEVLYKYPRKVYFDIDKVVNDDPTETFNEYINQLTTKISEYFPRAEYSISGSCCNITDTTTYKISVHIIINNYIISNVEEFINLEELVIYLNKNYDNGFDIRVYSKKSQNFKCANQSKPDGRIQKIILNCYLTDHLISCFFSPNSYSLPDFKITCNDTKFKHHLHDTKVIKKLDFGTLPKLKIKIDIPEDFNIDDDDTKAEEYLKLLPISNKFAHDYTHKIARFCFRYNIPFETFYDWYKVKNNTSEARDKWIKHWERLAPFPHYDISNIKSILLFYYPKIKDKKSFNELKNNIEIRPDNVNVSKIDKLSEQEFDNLILRPIENNQTTWTIDKVKKNKINFVAKDTAELKFSNGPKYNIMNIGKAGGKTEQTVKFLAKIDNFYGLRQMKH